MATNQQKKSNLAVRHPENKLEEAYVTEGKPKHQYSTLLPKDIEKEETAEQFGFLNRRLYTYRKFPFHAQAEFFMGEVCVLPSGVNFFWQLCLIPGEREASLMSNLSH